MGLPEAALQQAHKLVGMKGFQRSNPMTDRFKAIKFHHIDWWCADATSLYKRFSWGLGMPLVAKSDLSTGNQTHATYVLKSNDLVFAVSAPYSRKTEKSSRVPSPMPWYSQKAAADFVTTHGLGVRAVGVLVEDAAEAHAASTSHGAVSVLAPTRIVDAATATDQTVAEIALYGDVVLRFVSGTFQGPFLAGCAPVEGAVSGTCGLQRLDHAVGNVHHMMETIRYIANATGFHEFAEFTAEDVGTVDSGLNSMVLASNNELVILPVNEPTFGTPRKSQIQTYLEQNEGPGLQHLALKSDDIIATMRQLRARSQCGGFDFMPPASADYYKKLPEKIGDVLTPEQYAAVEELGILVDKDDQGVLLQIFSIPISDRPTVFLEVIQRIGCMREVPRPPPAPPALEQAGGCGGFGKGNFSELFKSIEDYERTLHV